MEEIKLKYKTRGTEIKDKSRVYFCYHPDDFDKYFEEITEEILDIRNCVIYYKSNKNINSSEIIDDLSQINLFVIPVTWKFISEECDARVVEFQYAMDNHIPVLPLMMEPSIDSYFNEKCGNLQTLSKLVDGEEKYKSKLKEYIESILVSDELRKQVQEAFDAYIFLSYRKKDKKHAENIMHLIHENEFCRDIAIWYDEFLKPGQDFNESIDQALKKSKLFALVVTPNLVNERNYVEKIEYPNAKKEGKNIVPIEAVDTSKEELQKKYKEIPKPIKVDNTEVLSKSLKKYLINEAWKENDDPKHLYFIGLAYLNGIDVEVNKEKGIKLLEQSGNLDCEDAMKELIYIYEEGKGTKLDYKKALEWQKKVYEKDKKELGENNLNTLISLTKLAIAYRNIGNYYKSLELNKECYEKQIEVLGENNLNTLDSLNNLARNYDDIGKYDIAIKLGENVYKKRREILGETHINTLTSLNNLAVSYSNIGNYDMAIKLGKEVYEKRKETLGKNHPNTLTSLNRLSIYYNYKEDYKEAIKLGEKVYKNRKETLGDEHPDTLRSLNNLAFYYNHMQNYNKAVKLGENVYNKIKKILGKSHPNTLTALNNLATYYCDIGNYDIALKLGEEAYKRSTESLKETHPNTLRNLNNLASIYKKMGDYNNSLKLYEKLYKLQCKVYSENNEKTKRTLEEIEVLKLK